MAIGDFVLYSSGIEGILDGTILLESHTIKAYLAGNGYTPDVDADVDVSDLSDEASNYTRPTVTGASVSRAGGTITFTSGDLSITASGGNAVGKYLVLFDDTAAGDRLIGYWDLDDTSSSHEITINDGSATLFVIHADGIFTAEAA